MIMTLTRFTPSKLRSRYVNSRTRSPPPLTVYGFETPFSLVRVTRVENHVLVLVLDAVELPDHLVMTIVEGNERDNVCSELFKP